MTAFLSFSGFIRRIDDYWTGPKGPSGCYKIVTVQNNNGNIVNFIVSPETYVLDFIMLRTGDYVTGFYDADAPVPLIYPPQYQAIVMARNSELRNVKVDFFNGQLISSDGMLKLNLTPLTPILLVNGQAFTGNPTNRDLIVVYGPTTKSIPAQTTPYKVIVMCR
jgi:hypothetical protein